MLSLAEETKFIVMGKTNRKNFHYSISYFFLLRLTREPEMQEWLHLGKPEHKLNHRLSKEISTAIDRFYFNHYCRIFQSGAFARATASMCVINLAVNTSNTNLIKSHGKYGRYVAT